MNEIITDELVVCGLRCRGGLADFRRVGCICSSRIIDTVDSVSSLWLLSRRSSVSRVLWSDSGGVAVGFSSSSVATSMTTLDGCSGWVDRGLSRLPVRCCCRRWGLVGWFRPELTFFFSDRRGREPGYSRSKTLRCGRAGAGASGGWFSTSVGFSRSIMFKSVDVTVWSWSTLVIEGSILKITKC